MYLMLIPLRSIGTGDPIITLVFGMLGVVRCSLPCRLDKTIHSV